MRLALFAPVLLLAACGYSPLYAPGEGAAGAKDRLQIGTVEMDAVETDVGQRRVAQTVAQRLKLDFPRTGADLDTATVTIDEGVSALAMQPTSALRRAQINLTGRLTVVNPEGQAILRTDLSTAAAYNVESSPYSTESGKTFARLTAARTLAEEISRRVALFYRTRQNLPVTAPAEAPSATTVAPRTISLTVPLPFKP